LLWCCILHVMLALCQILELQTRCSQFTSRGPPSSLAACIRQIPPDWKRPACTAGRPSHTWLRAIEAHLGPPNFGLATAWWKATTRDEWRHIVDTATLQRSTLWKKEERRHDTDNVYWSRTVGSHVPGDASLAVINVHRTCHGSRHLPVLTGRTENNVSCVNNCLK